MKWTFILLSSKKYQFIIFPHRKSMVGLLIPLVERRNGLRSLLHATSWQVHYATNNSILIFAPHSKHRAPNKIDSRLLIFRSFSIIFFIYSLVFFVRARISFQFLFLSASVCVCFWIRAIFFVYSFGWDIDVGVVRARSLSFESLNDENENVGYKTFYS